MRRLLTLALLATGCGGTTGSALVSFSATASGPADATGGPIAFISGSGAHVTLTRARLHLGAVYLNQSVPTSGAAAGPCISPGIYVGEAFGPLDIDLLSPVAQPFPVRGEGTQTAAKTAEVWLTGGDVNADIDSTVILEVEGTAQQSERSYPFTGSVTISANRKANVTNPALPGASPICHQRIVTPILVDLTPTNGGTLKLQVDPRPMFNGVDFASLGTPDGSFSLIPDDSSGAGGALYRGLHSNAAVYTFTWSP
jgi:hypothetical protein